RVSGLTFSLPTSRACVRAARAQSTAPKTSAPSASTELPLMTALTIPPQFRLGPLSSEQPKVTDSPAQRPRVGINRSLPADAANAGEWTIDAGNQRHWRPRIQPEGGLG